LIYLDANALIYTVEKKAPYWSLLQPVWQAVTAGKVRCATSSLALLEVLVMPIRNGDAALVTTYEALLHSQDVDLIPIEESVLREAARLRALKLGLRTPDAIHAATAVVRPVGLFLTNDPDFRKVSGLPVTVLSDLLGP
jgi:predicted nucleic acid-binding protein